jgi:anaerobic selenocysteine-containing dehydrogenase
MKEKNKSSNDVTRRAFLKNSALLGAVAGGSMTGIGIMSAASENEKKKFQYEIQKPENQIFSCCLQCHNACSIKGKVFNGLLGKIDGNPYGPQTMLPHIDYQNSPMDASLIDGKVCPKGQAGIQTLYDPYRIKKVLKRKGKRGDNKWEAVDFHKAIDEIVNGGDLFGEGPVKGLKDIIVLTDPKVAKEMAADAKKFGKGEMTLDEFKSKHAANLDKLIDPDHPDMGPKNNLFTMQCGRIEHGRKELGKRFTFGTMGSKNFFEHTTICEQSHHIGYKEITNKWAVKDGKGKWTGGKTHLKPDFLHAEFVIFFGTGAFEANFGKTSMAQKVTDALVDRNFKMAVVDPRMSQTAAKANWWIPIRPGADAAFSWGMINWIIENERFDKKALSNSNYAAAKASGETTVTDATLLVKIEDGKPTKFLRAAEIGVGSDTEFVTMVSGSPVKVDLKSETPIIGDLFTDTELKGIQVQSAFQLIKDEANSKSIDDWAGIAGVESRQVIELAKEFTSHGKKACVEFYRGPVQHTNGYYNAVSLIYLNMLVGNTDWIGGMQKGGGHWHEDGSHHGYWNMKSANHPNKLTPFGPPITREKMKYEDTSLFRENGYPAKRNWYPHSGNVYQEILPSGEDLYPYGIECLILHKGTPLLASPAGSRGIEYVSDPKKLPLFITSDIIIGESSMFADYIFPDTTYMERWGTPHITPDVAHKGSKVRQPIVPSITEMVEINGEKMPINLEAVYIAIADKLNLSGFNENAFDNGMSFKRSEDWYLKFVANIAKGDHEGEEVPEASNEEMELFINARRHFPKEYFNIERLKKAVGNDESIWRRVVYVLNRGGRYKNYADAYKKLPYNDGQLKGFMKFFVENVANSKNPFTGENFSGLGIYQKIQNFDGKETNFENREENEFRMSTFKEVFGGQSRTISNYWTQLSIKPENALFINKMDADRLGLTDNDWVTIVSESNPTGEIDLKNGTKVQIKSRVRPIQGIRPGVVTMSWHFGHWAYGSRDVEIDGQIIKGDIRRRDSACPNPVMAVDKTVGNMTLTDPIGASAAFYNTKVSIKKI